MNSKEQKLHITIEHHGPAATHNLMCWVCSERKAVYHMNPVWVFGPCWECEKRISGRLYRIKSKLLRKLLG